MTDHDTEHKGIIMTITEDTDMDPKPYTLTAISIGLEGAATGMALAGGHWLLSLLFLAADRAVRHQRMAGGRQGAHAEDRMQGIRRRRMPQPHHRRR